MAVKTINYTVDLYRMINPSSVQDAGVQGDHKVTELKFNISSALWDWLTTKKGSGRLVYRFDGFDGSRGVHRSDIATLTSSTVTYQLENYLTRYGGLVEVQLVISVLGINNSEVEFVKNELCSYTAKLRLAFSNFANNDNDAEFQSLSSLAAIAKSSAQVAQDKAKEAKEAQAKTEAAKQALQSGETVYIFDGGDVNGEVYPQFVVDDEMSDSSGNLVPNKVIKEYIDRIIYPVGSVYVSGERVNPSAKLGGKWELLDKEFRNESVLINDFNEAKEYATIYEDAKITNLGIGIIRGGKTIRLRLQVTSEYDFTDTSVKLLQLNLNKFGINTGVHINYNYVTMLTDYANGGIIVNLGYNGELVQSDIIGKFRTKTVGGVNVEYVNSYHKNPDTGVEGYHPYFLDVTLVLGHNQMLDEFCDKFYWRRIG